MERAKLKTVPIESSIPEAGADKEAYMIWILGSLGYVIAVVSIVRFFQFVTDTDRSIMKFTVAVDGMSELRAGVREIVSSSTKVAKRQGTLKTKKPTKDFSRRVLRA
jgi:hypothetical protein